jgi:two-component system response regulator MprA
MGSILIVEDHAPTRDLLFDAFMQEGYQAISASDGAEGLTKLRLRHPEFVLLDLNLPVLDGDAFLRGLRESGIPSRVLVMTADPRGSRLTPADGVCGHVPKPFNLDDLFAAIRLVGLPPTIDCGANA